MSDQGGPLEQETKASKIRRTQNYKDRGEETQKPRGRITELLGGHAGSELVAPAFDVVEGQNGVSYRRGEGTGHLAPHR